MLLSEDKILNLNQSYEFKVSVEDEDKKFAGRLILSPEKCTLKVMGEREPSRDFFLSKEIKCNSFNRYFWLFDLSEVYWGSQCLRSTIDENIGFFECEFEIGFIVSSETYYPSDCTVLGFSIDSPMIGKWVGMTKTQNNLVEKYHKKTLKPMTDDTTEVIQPINGYGALILYYHLETHYNSKGFSSGLNFPPRLNIAFESYIPLNKLSHEIHKLYDLMTLYVGSDFDMETIEISTSQIGFSVKTSAYYPRTNRTHEMDYPVYPLGHDLQFNDLPIPALSLDSVNQYFNLSEGDRVSFSKYLRYKRMKSDEERFLGYFRILERLTNKKGTYVEQGSLDNLLDRSEGYLRKKLNGKKKDVKNLIGRIKKMNGAKYNTDKCIGDFYDCLPPELKGGLLYDKQGIQKICKLRNDITHANDYVVRDSDLSKYSSFIEVLLYLALLNKIGIHPEVSSSLAHRLNRFHFVQKFDG
ncbi:HEPN domain-containing protein [Vibrio splendidus]|uniref:ApeA N-terminal domain 1-containing protein n=1 Tax=Vibrio splendidus TaxID=29497 RepID=UPI0034A0BE4D